MSATLCHALHVRLPSPVDAAVVAERFAAIALRCRAPGLDVPPTVWVERAPADADLLARRLHAELDLPVSAGRGLRTTLLCHDGGQAELVLVAHRAVADHGSLRRLVTALVDDGPDLSWSATLPATVAAVATVVPAWGLGGATAGTGELAVGPWAAGGDSAAWLAALAVVLSRYQGGEGAMAAVLPAADRPLHVLGSFDTTVTHTVATSHDTLATLAAGFRSPAAARPVKAGVVAGLVFDAEDPPADGKYHAWLAAPFPLTIGVGSTRLRFGHDGTVGPETATRFVRHLATVHRQVVESPHLPADEAELFNEAGRRPSGTARRSARRSRDAPARIHDVFAARVAERPNAVAVGHEQHRLTYRQLDRLSDRLATGLRRIGVQDGDRVGICLKRSVELVATMLAVLKAGAAYVPMDPAHPAGRLAYTASDAGLTIVVTTLDGFPPVAVAVTPDELSTGTDAAAGPPTSTAVPADPAYVIYTSGSTGRPKGVVVPHVNVVRLLEATRDEFGLGPTDVWTLFHSSAFDFSVWEIWGCLLTGARLVVVPFWVSRSPEEFHDLLVDEQVTILNQTPSAFTHLSEVDRSRLRPLPVRLVVFGGEPLDARTLLPWFDRHPETRCRVVNMFGITETTVHVTATTVTRQSALAASRSVGRPLPGWSVRVLDPAGRPVPPGVAGEIYVGGVGVAVGYLNRPDLDAERFVVVDGERIYRSGDKGRLRPDGTLEHLGRLDNQVKIRGFRIELDEIRSVLAEDPAVAAAAVVLRAGDAATTGVDAYVVLDGASVDDVRRRAARMLPEHMVPTSVTVVPSLPLTTNGKVDVDRLPAPAKPNMTNGTGASVGDDGLVEDLRDVWNAVLGVEVGPDDDFFDLGGNSLIAIRIAARSRERRLPTMSLRTLYQHPTVRGLVEAIRTRPQE